MLEPHYLLRQVVRPDSGQPIEIHIAEDEVHVGRRKIISLTKFPQISRDHAVFYKSDSGTLFVKDLNSLNGIFVNDAKIGSSLKVLNIGDVIGFGVPSSSADEGFVCVLCTSAKVKAEVIEISDEDDFVSDSRKKSNLRTSIPEEDSASSSQWKIENISGRKNFPEPRDIGNAQRYPVGVKSIKHESDCRTEEKSPQNARVKTCVIPVVRCDAPEPFEIGNAPRSLESIENFQHESGCKTTRKPPKNTRAKACGIPAVKCVTPELFEVGNTPRSQEDIENFQHENDCEIGSKSPENTPVKTCLISVTKCDSDQFQCPPDVKNPLGKNRKRSLKHPRKRIGKSSSDSSEDSEEGVHPVVSSKENLLSSTFRYEGNSDCQSNSRGQAAGRKRKLSDVSCCETLMNEPSSSKKIDCSLEPEAKKDHEFQDKSDNDANYSQVEEIIYISDDESYFDFKSSQNYVHIKNEPEEVDHDNEGSLYKEVFERESNSEHEHLSGNQSGHRDQDPDDRIECIESIRAFVRNLEDRNSNAVSAGVTTSVRNDSMFPTPSHDTGSSESSESTDSGSDDNDELCSAKWRANLSTVQNLTEETQVCNTDFAGNRNAKKSGGKILLIDPKPMSYRPRRLRGRDEGFVEKAKPLDRHGSAIQKHKASRNKKVVENEIFVSRARKSKIPRQDQVNEKNSTVPELAGASRNTKSSSPKRICVKRRLEKFSSRMGFLIDGVEVNPQHGNKVKKIETQSKKNDFRQAATEKASFPERNKDFTNKSTQSASTDSTFNSFRAVNNEVVSTNKYVGENPVTSRGSYLMEGKLLRTFSNNTKISSSTDVSEKTAPPAKTSSPFFSLSFDGLIKNLLQLNSKWLQEQAAVKAPPSAVSKGAADLPLSYKSYDAYVSSFYPMIMLEIWECMYTESKEVYASNKQNKKFYFSILSYTSREDCIELKCESVVSERVCFCPREGVIVVLELKENSHKCSPLFGYIFKHKVQPLNLSSLKISRWKDLPKEWLQNAKHWTFHAYIKKKYASFEMGSLMKGNGLCYIRSKLRLADALRFVKDSPLLKDILIPRESTFAANPVPSSPEREHSSSQIGVINFISDEISKPHQQPKIVLLQGPPGTGKTHAIVGLLEKLFYDEKNKSNLKVLVAAPSNEAVDEIGCRLIELNKKSGKKDGHIKFVRVGLEKQIHAKVMPYFVDSRAKELYHQSSQFAESREKELQNLFSEINKLEMNPPSKYRDERIKYLRAQCEHLKGHTSAKPMDYHTEMVYKTSVLEESRIILCTLSSCGLSFFIRSFKSSMNSRFSCCIIDEATQCTELEVLQPLAFGISKLVLVGDHEQLPPTVISKLASQYGFERSMFERFHLFFQRLNKNLILTLTEQFRMHPDICEFPSKHFYAHKLLTHPSVSLKYKDFPLHPYTVLDVSTDPRDLPLKTDATVMWCICKFLLHFTSSIGVIVSHQAKRSLYMKTLFCDSRCRNIEINTVDGFQGREKDVIVLSAVNASKHEEGASFLNCKQQLNVSITRARKCLIICGNSAELMLYPDWRILMHDAQERNLCVSVSSSRHISEVLENYVRKKRR